MKISTTYSFAVLLILVLVYSCKKDNILTDESASISISVDTLKFDTLFTQTGSVTQSFKIINTNNQPIVLSSVKLIGGNNTPFKMNVNGVSTTEVNDIGVAANDSIYVFVMANVNPNNSSLPFVVSDSIQIICNNNIYQVQLEAYAQNAQFCNNLTIRNDTTWTNTEPIVVLGRLTVDSGATLTLQEGCRIYVHANSPIYIDGTLKANGSSLQHILFCGDRLDEPYRYLPGSWIGIHFRNTSKDNELRFCNILNAKIGLHVENPSVNTSPKLLAHQITIDNTAEAGIKLVNTSLDIDNSLISNGKKNVLIENGGNYNFVNCTLVAGSTIYQFHEFPQLELNNYNLQNGNMVTNNLKAVFTNCVVWSNDNLLDDEISVTKEGNGLFDVLIENSLLKNSIEPNDVTVSDIIRNIDPLFDSIDVENNYFDFRTQNNISSPLQNAGKFTSFLNDLDNRPRLSGTATDIGCYEKQE